MSILNQHHIYTIPVGEDFGCKADACYLIYAPLANVFFLATLSEVNNITLCIKNGEQTDVTKALLSGLPLSERNPFGCSYASSTTLYLLLNEKCNFHCKYCYSAGGRSKEEMNIEQMKASIKYFLGKRNAPESRTIMFVGGGEPTLSWDKVVIGTEYAEELAEENGIKLKIRLSTNGSILTDEMLSYYKQHNFQLQCSFEVLKDIQDHQRGSFDIVDKNIKRLLSNGIHCNIRATITVENVDRIAEMVEFCHCNYPTIDALLCEPVVDPEYFKTKEIVDDYQTRYFESFKQGLQLAMKYCIHLMSSNYGSIRQLRERFCYNLMCVTPYGTLTTCPNISSPQEEGYEQAVFGTVNNDEISFDDVAYKRLTSHTIYNDKKCASCWAKWNCGGGCPNQRRVYSSDIFDTICEHFRNMLKYYILMELGMKYKKQTGRDMFDDISLKLK